MAEEKVAVLGQGALLQAIEISKILYKSTYGIAKHSDEVLGILMQALANDRFEDSYTHAALALELARTDTLRGELVKAKDQLDLSSALVYKIVNPSTPEAF